ncbi:hypothetical protein ACWX0K_15075 [Nitrobacteraceae bacterium UC4446_H13]
MPRTDILDYYVSIVRDGRKRGLLAGPFATHTEAIANVPAARDEAYNVDPWAWWDLFGTCSLPRDLSNPTGTLNHRLGIVPRSLPAPPY